MLERGDAPDRCSVEKYHAALIITVAAAVVTVTVIVAGAGEISTIADGIDIVVNVTAIGVASGVVVLIGVEVGVGGVAWYA